MMKGVMGGGARGDSVADVSQENLASVGGKSWALIRR